MCKFFSIVTEGDGVPKYFDVQTRASLQENNPNSYDFDSHTSIAHFHNLNDDLVNKYEYCPFTKVFIVDQRNLPQNDQKQIETWCRSFDFMELIEQGEYDLDLSGCTIPDGFVFPTSVGGSLYLNGCTIPKGIVLPTSVGGYLDLNGCTIPDGIVLPTSVGGEIYR